MYTAPLLYLANPCISNIDLATSCNGNMTDHISDTFYRAVLVPSCSSIKACILSGIGSISAEEVVMISQKIKVP